MNENVGNIIINDDITKFRRNLRVGGRINVPILDEKTLIVSMMNTNPEDENATILLYKNLSEYFLKHSISNSPMLEQTFGFLYELMRNENIVYKVYGMKCFICIFCQETYIFDQNYAQIILAFVVSNNNYNNEDSLMVQLTLHIISKISATSAEMAKLASKYIDLAFLVQVCLADISLEIKDKAICILNNLCCSMPLRNNQSGQEMPMNDGENEKEMRILDSDFVEMIVNLTEILLPAVLSQERTRVSKRVIESIVNCCYSLAKRFEEFYPFFENHNLFPIFTAILDDDDQSSKTIYNIIRIAEILFHDSAKYQILDINKIFGMISNPSTIIQIASLQCMLNTLHNNNEIAPVLMSNGIIPMIFEIFRDGSRKGKSYCCELLHDLYQLFPQELTPVIASKECVELLCSLIPDGSRRKISFILKICIKMHEMISLSGGKKQLKELFESIDSFNDICDLASHEDAQIAELASLLIECVED